MLFCAALQIRLYICLTDDVVSSSLRHEVGMGGGGWGGLRLCPPPNKQLPSGLGAARALFWGKPGRTPSCRPRCQGKTASCSQRERRVLCAVVCVCCAWQRVGLLGCSPAVSEAALPALRARTRVLTDRGFYVCVAALRWVMTQRKESEHTVLNSADGPRDKCNSALHSFIYLSPLQSFHHLSSPAFISAPHSVNAHLVCVFVFVCLCSYPNKGMVFSDVHTLCLTALGE